MLIPPGPIRVLVATKPVDFRKGMDGLAALVKEQLKGDPFSGVIFCFRSKRADRSQVDLLGRHRLVSVRQETGRRQVPLAAHRGRRDAAVGSAIGGVDRGSGLDARTGAARACTRSCAVACGEVNQAPVWLWQIACNVLCLARETVG